MSISTPILAFPQGGRDKTFPPWRKMKGGKWLYKLKIFVTKILKYNIAIGRQKQGTTTLLYRSGQAPTAPKLNRQAVSWQVIGLHSQT